MFQKIIIIKIHMETVWEADKSLDGDVMTMTAVVYDTNTSEQTIKQCEEKSGNGYFICELAVASSLMRFEAWDVVTEIYSCHNQDFTTLLDPNRLHTDQHTPKIAVEFLL